MPTQIDLAFNAINAVVIVGLAAGAGVTALAQQRQQTQALTIFGLPAMLIALLFCLADGLLLWALPHLRLSFAPDASLSLVAMVFVRLSILCGLMGAAILSRWRNRRQMAEPRTHAVAILFLVANLGLSLAQVDAFVMEPLLIETTELSLTSANLNPAAPPVRIVHLTDTHVERYGLREAGTIRRVNALQPDIIVLTGDYLNLSYLSDPTAADHFRQLVNQLQAPFGIYAVRGSVEPTPESMTRLLDGTEVVWLEQEAITVNVRGQPVTLVGVACSHRQQVDAERLARATAGIPGDTFTVLLYHSPDLIHEAIEQEMDLYLGGHTHGGQVRLPFYGAIVTGSRYGKQYISGLFREGDTTMYISRGLGFEGGGMPRARFLCRPEIVSLEIEGR
jgi:predicted MPP superfamily phosphohydrolase